MVVATWHAVGAPEARRSAAPGSGTSPPVTSSASPVETLPPHAPHTPPHAPPTPVPRNPLPPSTAAAALSPSALMASEQPALKVGTLLRQWLELRPEMPPVAVRPWLFLGGAHHACDRALLDRLDVGFVLNVANDIANFFEHEPTADSSDASNTR